jgi:hypothetical protein
MQPRAHSGFLQSLESVTEFSRFDSRGNGTTEFDIKNTKTLKNRHLSWAAMEVLKAYNDDQEPEQELTFKDVTR